MVSRVLFEKKVMRIFMTKVHRSEQRLQASGTLVGAWMVVAIWLCSRHFSQMRGEVSAEFGLTQACSEQTLRRFGGRRLAGVAGTVDGVVVMGLVFLGGNANTSV